MKFKKLKTYGIFHDLAGHILNFALWGPEIMKLRPF